MEFSWTPPQRARYDAALATARQRFAPESGTPGIAPEDWRTLGEHGLLGAAVEPKYGGGGLGALDTALLFEAFGRGCPDTGLVFAAAAHLFACAMPIAEFGPPALRERLLPGLCAGESVAANAMTEPDAGSDVSTLATTATPVDGGYLLTGTKSFVSNGPDADVFVTYATTDPGAGHFALTAFVVERGATGLHVGEPFGKLGMASCPAGQVEFADCFVPHDSVLGERGQGSVVFQQSMLWERTCLFALYVGLQDRLVDQVVAHAKERRQFGRPLREFQSVSNRIVEMKLRLESSRLLLYRACWSLDRAEPDPLCSALSKLAVSEAAVASAVDAVQLLAGRGYRTGQGVEAALRDALGGTIFSGTSDIQRQIVARELGL
ncbi:acyl-CoA dehydrogenase family protein [Plantactinospora soyae]|uniref:Alkylation response protein AidB-like acyl-CoA dehydrogenase n=1 Tax=Plantactinospora soyae TaxID=1544732 RepID=A0A927M8T8_9ACTN|nr:acyl-CoA dehydrogenase family protein [Plantactinospora soyae]MBE1489192.1 alkylation response protein AidB-like acyl-CoA dehydrogenase [Plantactinospora soyae]